MLGRCVNRLFLEHPRAQGETYLQHMKVATDIGLRFGVASVFTLVHAFIPGVNLFESFLETTSSKYINDTLEIINRSPKIEDDVPDLSKYDGPEWPKKDL